MVIRRTALAGIAASSLLAACRGAGAPGPLAVGNAAGALNQTLAEMLRQQGFLRQFGLAPEIIEVADGSRIVRGIVGGSLTASLMSGFGQIFPAIERGADLRLIGGAINLPVLALYSGNPAIKGLAGLAGKTVGIGSIGALIHQLTVTLLRQAGIDPVSVRFVTIGSSAEIFRAVRAGTVDAGVGPASLVERASDLGVTAIAGGNMAAALPQFTYAGAWTSAAAIAQRRDELVRLLAAHLKLYRFAQSPEGRSAFIAARSAIMPKADPREHEAEWRFIERFRPLTNDLELSGARTDYLQDMNVTFGVQKARLPLERVADMSLASDARKLVDG